MRRRPAGALALRGAGLFCQRLAARQAHGLGLSMGLVLPPAKEGWQRRAVPGQRPRMAFCAAALRAALAMARAAAPPGRKRKSSPGAWLPGLAPGQVGATPRMGPNMPQARFCNRARARGAWRTQRRRGTTRCVLAPPRPWAKAAMPLHAAPLLFAALATRGSRCRGPGRRLVLAWLAPQPFEGVQRTKKSAQKRPFSQAPAQGLL